MSLNTTTGSAPRLRTKGGEPIPAVSPEHYLEMRQLLKENCHLTDTHLVTQASYGCAMVVRSSLGLTAASAIIFAMVAPSIEGAVVLATLRHLAHGGAACSVGVLTQENPTEIEAFEAELQILHPIEVPVEYFSNTNSEGPSFFATTPRTFHALLMGLPPEASLPPPLIEQINDSPIAVHTISAPYGVNIATGEPARDAICATTTVALGVPYTGIASAPNWFGRLYAADISLPTALIEQFGYEIGNPFAEQPIQQVVRV